MNGTRTIFKKELADHLSSNRFLILFALIFMVSLVTAYMAGMNIAKQSEGAVAEKFIFLKLFTSSGGWFSLVQFVAFFGPLIGLILGFDTVNRERNEGTLSKLLSQPIFRDDVINGKFLAGVTVIAVMMVSIVALISAIGLIKLGVKPGIEEFSRICIYLLISIIYISFWLGMAILFSILFRNVATSALAGLAVWIFFSFFISLAVGALGNLLTQNASEYDPESYIRRARIEQALVVVSPMQLYSDSTATIIDPMRNTTKSMVRMGMYEQISMARFAGPLPLQQSILIVLPYIISLIAITAVCFAISYMVFMRQEIRSV